MKYFYDISKSFYFFYFFQAFTLLSGQSTTTDSIACNEEAYRLILAADSISFYDLNEAEKTLAQIDTQFADCISDQNRLFYYQTFSSVLYLISDFKRAISYSDSALSLSIALQDTYNINFTKSLLGDINASLGNIEKALDYYLQTIPYDQKNNDSVNLAYTYLNIANIHFINKEYLEVGQYLDKIELIINKKENLFNVPNEVYKFRAWIGIKEKNLSLADSMIRLLEGSIDRIKDKAFVSDFYYLRSEYFLQTKNLDSAKYFLSKAILLAKEMGDRYKIAEYYFQISKIALKTNDDRTAEEYILKGEKLADSIASIILFQELFKLKHDLSMGKGDFRSAEHYLSLYNKFSDSLRSERMHYRISKIEELRNEMEHQHLLHHQLLLQEKNEKHELLLQRRKTILTLTYILLLVSLMAIGVIYYYYRKAKQSNRTKDRMISVISHDLRGPVYQIEQLLDLAIQSQDMNMVKKARMATSNLRKTFDNLLYWAKSQLEGKQLNKTEIRLEDAVMAATNFYQPALDDKNIHIHTVGIEDKTIEFDPVHFEIILRNLLSNAVKFTPKGGEIEIKAIANDKELILEVHDTGVGIPEDLQKRMFDKRHMFTTRGTNNEPGAGLGLSLAYYFAQKNGATLTVQSKPGEGSTFQLHIPNT